MSTPKKILSEKEKECVLQKIQKDLPKNWIAQYSKKYESRVYFFNTATGERSWKHPIHNVFKEKEKKQSQKRKSDETDVYLEAKNLEEGNCTNPKHQKIEMPGKDISKSCEIKSAKKSVPIPSHKMVGQDKYEGKSKKARRKKKRKPSKHIEEEESSQNIVKSEPCKKQKPKPIYTTQNKPNCSQQRNSLNHSYIEGVKASQAVHSANASYEDVEMADLSLQMPEITEVVKTPETKNVQKSVFIIVDTNVLLHSLSLSKIGSFALRKSQYFPAYKEVCFIIPWMVLQELDNLKKSKTGARTAITFLNKQFLHCQSTIRGQTIFEAAAVIDGLEVETNDDRILQCCFFMKQSSKNNFPILLTRDKNLMNKALTNGFKCFEDLGSLERFLGKSCQNASVEKGINAYPSRFIENDIMPIANSSPVITSRQLPSKSNSGSSDKPVGKISPESSMIIETESKISESKMTNIDKNNNNETNNKCTSSSQKVFPDNKKLFKRCHTHLLSSLSFILEKEMKSAFGDLWLDIVLLKPPWTLPDVLKCINKHWLSVFKMMEVDSLVQIHVANLMKLDKKMRERSVSDEKLTIIEWILSAKHLLLGIQQKGKYGKPVTEDLIALKHLHKAILDTKDARSKSEESIVKSEPNILDIDDSDTSQNSSQNILNISSEDDSAKNIQMITDDFWIVLDKIWTTIIRHCALIFQSLEFIPSQIDNVPEVSIALRENYDSVPDKPIAAHAIPLVTELVQSLKFGLGRLISSCENHEDACQGVFVDLLQTLWTTIQAFSVECHLQSLLDSHVDICKSITSTVETMERLKSGFQQLDLVLNLLEECQTVLSSSVYMTMT